MADVTIKVEAELWFEKECPDGTRCGSCGEEIYLNQFCVLAIVRVSGETSKMKLGKFCSSCTERIKESW